MVQDPIAGAVIAPPAGAVVADGTSWPSSTPSTPRFASSPGDRRRATWARLRGPEGVALP